MHLFELVKFLVCEVWMERASRYHIKSFCIVGVTDFFQVS